MSLCYAIGCNHKIRPGLLMCKKHWQAVPKTMQDQVYASLKKYGVTEPEYHSAIDAARYYVAFREAQQKITLLEHEKEPFGLKA